MKKSIQGNFQIYISVPLIYCGLFLWSLRFSKVHRKVPQQIKDTGKLTNDTLRHNLLQHYSPSFDEGSL